LKPSLTSFIYSGFYTTFYILKNVPGNSSYAPPYQYGFVSQSIISVIVGILLNILIQKLAISLSISL